MLKYIYVPKQPMCMSITQTTPACNSSLRRERTYFEGSDGTEVFFRIRCHGVRYGEANEEGSE